MFQKLFLCLIGCFLLGCKEENSSIVVGTSADYPPYMFYKNGEIVGFEKDVMDAIAHELKLQFTFKDLPFDSLIGGLQSKRIDMAISAISATAEREKQVDFSKPYHHITTALVVEKDSKIKDLKTLKGITVGVQSGSTHEKTAKEEWTKKAQLGSVKSLVKVPDLIQDLKTKRIQAIALGTTESHFIVKAHPEFKVVELPTEKESFSIAMPKDSKLLPQINELIEKWSKNGKLKSMFKKWSSHS